MTPIVYEMLCYELRLQIYCIESGRLLFFIVLIWFLPFILRYSFGMSLFQDDMHIWSSRNYRNYLPFHYQENFSDRLLSDVRLSVRLSVCKLFTFSSSPPEPLGQF